MSTLQGDSLEERRKGDTRVLAARVANQLDQALLEAVIVDVPVFKGNTF
jgi:hypothetical protein